MKTFKRIIAVAPELLTTYAVTVGSVVTADVFADFLSLKWVQIFAVSGTVAGILGRSPIFATLKKLADGTDE
jgi:hypothetical protein